MVRIEIDGQELEARPGANVIEIADEAGIYIPRFCYHEKLSVAANCRMCLVQIENAPKPMPACATPVMDGMKVYTHSEYAVAAQKDTLEFLLINHPLDCPICDQGGECPLQDQAVGYGGHASRFIEKKRVVPDHDIGPLIQTEMTRCIHCTRCVRFGEEVAGVMELGITGRGEHLKIDTFIGQGVNSEVSGNAIDLCPVGALTSKPYRFTARSWELISHDSVSPHDCVGTNIDIQTLRGEVKRVLPRINEGVNECWISDRDRYSYDSLIESAKLAEPMIRTEEGMVKTDWRTALDTIVNGVNSVVQEEGSDALGALVSPTATFEESYLIQKLLRGLGSHNIDHRLRQVDFSDDLTTALYPGMTIPIEKLSQAKAVLLIGSNIRKEQPLLGLRVRKAWMNGARVAAINSISWQYNFDLSSNIVVPPSKFTHKLEGLLEAVRQLRADNSYSHPDGDEYYEMAEMLCNCNDDAVIILGQAAISHAQYSEIKHLVQQIAKVSGASMNILPPANSVASWIAGCLPHRTLNGVAVEDTGLNAWKMLHSPRHAYFLFNVDPLKDTADVAQAVEAMKFTRFVVSFQFFDEIPDYIDVALPLAPFTENSGTFINCEGRVQHATAATEPVGQARPGWKILRVLGNLFDVSGFEFTTIADIAAEAALEENLHVSQFSDMAERANEAGQTSNGFSGRFELISDAPIYAVDAIVRNSRPLQATIDAVNEQAHVHPEDMQQLGMSDGAYVSVKHSTGSANMNAISDVRIPRGCVYIPAGVGDGALPATGVLLQLQHEELL